LQQVDAAHAPANEPSASTSREATLEALVKLSQLRDQGILTEDEFAAKKAQILGT